MSSSGPSKMTGTKDEMLGSAKATMGKVMHNQEMEAKGHMQHEQGTAEKQAAGTKQKAEGTKDSTMGHMQKATGQALGNERMQGEGQMKQTKGSAEQHMS